MKKTAKSSATCRYPVLVSQAKAASSDREASGARRQCSNNPDILSPRPFPMSAQVLNSIGKLHTSQIAESSWPGKRSQPKGNATESEGTKEQSKNDGDPLCVYYPTRLLLYFA